MTKQIDVVTQYAQDVVDGKILASRKNIQSAKRHLRDIDLKVFNYHFDVSKANRVIKFLEMLPDPKSMKVLKLAGFQKFIAGSIYGWVNIDGDRRFNKAYISMARKSGKTLLISGLALYEMILGDEPANERLIGLTANSREQASIAFDMATAQLSAIRTKSKSIKNMTKITESKKEIFNLNDRSKIKAVSNEASNLEGYQFSFAIIDEYHEAKDNKMRETLVRGMVQLKNPTLIYISTAGNNLNVPMYAEYEYITKILNQEVVNENYFVYCAEQDSENEIHDSSLWQKSNPILELESLRHTLTRNIQAEVQEGLDKHDVLGIQVKNMNMWRQASKDSYIPYNVWQECYIDEELDIKGREVFIGVDLSRNLDLTAISFLYPTDLDKFHVDSHVFLGFQDSIEQKSTRDKIDYLNLIDRGLATLTRADSGIIDQEQMLNWLLDYIKDNQLIVKAVCYDQWESSYFVTKLEQDTDLPLIMVPQDVKNMGPALSQFRVDVYEKRITHNNNPNLNLALNNSIIKYDPNNNMQIDKQKNREKIDALVALVTGYTQARDYQFDRQFENYIMSDDFGF